MVLLTRESRPPPVFILFLKILYRYDKGFFCFIPMGNHVSSENLYRFILNRYGSRFWLRPMESILFDENGLKPVPIE